MSRRQFSSSNPTCRYKVTFTEGKPVALFIQSLIDMIFNFNKNLVPVLGVLPKPFSSSLPGALVTLLILSPSTFSAVASAVCPDTTHFVVHVGCKRPPLLISLRQKFPQPLLINWRQSTNTRMMSTCSSEGSWKVM